MNIIIGSSGFLSLSLIQDLPHHFNEESLISLRNDSVENFFENLKAFTPKESINIIFAAWPTNIYYDDIKHIEFFQNVAKPFFERLINLGTPVRLITYGTCLEYGLVEGALNEEELAKPCTKLGSAKLMLFDYCRKLIRPGNYVHLRIFYPYSHANPRKGSFLFHLDRALENNENIFKMSIGTQERDFFSRELLSNIIELLISSNNWNLNIINVGSCKPTKVIDLATAHMRQNGKKIKLDTTAYSIPWYEPFSFYAEHTHAVKAFLK